MAAAVTLTLEEEKEEVRDEADAIGAGDLVDPPARLAELAVLALAAPPPARLLMPLGSELYQQPAAASRGAAQGVSPRLPPRRV